MLTSQRSPRLHPISLILLGRTHIPETLLRFDSHTILIEVPRLEISLAILRGRKLAVMQ
jgi:hypothetical protein